MALSAGIYLKPNRGADLEEIRLRVVRVLETNLGIVYSASATDPKGLHDVTIDRNPATGDAMLDEYPLMVVVGGNAPSRVSLARTIGRAMRADGFSVRVEDELEGIVSLDS